MPDPKHKSSIGAYLNGTYLLLGCVASLVAIATGYIALREHKTDPHSAEAPAVDSPPIVQLKLPAVPATQPQLPYFRPPAELPKPPLPMPPNS